MVIPLLVLITIIIIFGIIIDNCVKLIHLPKFAGIGAIESLSTACHLERHQLTIA